jgi:hypothetical protein
VEIVEFDTLGHMGPVTHPDQVNEVIRQFLESPVAPDRISEDHDQARRRAIAAAAPAATGHGRLG